MGEKGTMTRRHILDSACPLFIRHGYKAVTMQDICRASGLSKGGLYRHYKDKVLPFFRSAAKLPGGQKASP